MDVFLSEEELSIEIGSLDVVWISYCNLSIDSYVEHGKVLYQFTADSTTSNHK